MGMGIWLKETLREKGMTIKQLSELSGVSLNTLYSITKRDSEKIDPVILKKISAITGTDGLLKPCPFCGKAPRDAFPDVCQYEKGKWEVNHCCKTDALARLEVVICVYGSSKKEAFDRWNRRSGA